jgi:hypothetical protein
MDGMITEQAAIGTSAVDFRKIKLAYQVNMVFQIK